MSDFSIIIPHRGNGLGLWATIHSCEEDLRESKFNYNYVIVTNGEAKSPEVETLLDYLDKTGRLKKRLHFQEGLTPPLARAKGASEADGRVLFFFDNHCLVAKNYFDRAMRAIEAYNMPMLHSSTIFHSGSDVSYHYRLGLEYNFWARSSGLPHEGFYHKPYKCAAAGHGGFAVTRDLWNAVGGYGPDNLLVGYGGEELIFDLKVWRYGYTNWIDPKVIHYHYAGSRGYPRKYTDDYYTNLLVSANVIGGEKWLYKVFQSFIGEGHLRVCPKKDWWFILEDAYNRSAEYAREVDKKSVMTLDELILYFKGYGIEM